MNGKRTEPTKDEKVGTMKKNPPLRAVWGWLSDVLEESLDMRESYTQKVCEDHSINRYSKLDLLLSDNDDCLVLQENVQNDSNHDGAATNTNSIKKKSIAHVSGKVVPVEAGSFTIDDSGSEEEDDLL